MQQSIFKIMDTIIGREEEIRRLMEFVDSNKAEFLVIYGRRRVGKTFLIKQFFKGKFTFYFSGAENASKIEQLANFREALNRYSGKTYPLTETWQQAFVQLTEYLTVVKTKNRKVIFIDELPWLDNAKSGFLSAFEYWWNTFASSKSEIFLVVCGSATSWIIKNIFKNRGGLYGRVTRQMYLQPFSLKETEQFFKAKKINIPRYQIAEYYMIMGGIPYYLEQIEKKYSLSQNIDNLFFRHNGILREEYKKIFCSTYKSPQKHLKIIEVLAQKRKGLSRDEISEFSGISNGGGLTIVLEELEQCGFIFINDNFSKNKKNKLYQLADFYTLFYLHFIKDKKSTHSDYWTTLIDNSIHRTWSGFSFEMLCLWHIEQIRKTLGVAGVLTYSSGWRSKEAKNNSQIDLIIDRNDNVINICEMKYSNKEYIISKEYDQKIQKRKWTFMEETKTKKALHTTLITTYGVKRNMYWYNIQSEVKLNDLFE